MDSNTLVTHYRNRVEDCGPRLRAAMGAITCFAEFVADEVKKDGSGPCTEALERTIRDLLWGAWDDGNDRDLREQAGAQ